MKHLGSWSVAATLLLSFTAQSFAQAPMGAPPVPMAEKGERMKGEMQGEATGEMKGGTAAGKTMMKERSDQEAAQTGTMMKSDTMMEKKAGGMETSGGMGKMSEGTMEKKQP
jgi:hypothetical protein